MTTFIHTADLQVGKPFAGIGDEPDPQKRVTVQLERIAVLERIAMAAAAHRAEFVLVAGDLFDSPRVTQATVSAACAAIGKIPVPLIVIPGNHDHGGPGSIWDQEFFKGEQAALAPNLRILLEPNPVELGAAVIFPCPLLRRHETADTTGWLRDIEGGWARFGDRPRIVLAHGSVQGFGAQDDDEEHSAEWVNRIDISQLPLAAIDYIALGDWHGTKQAGDKAWYSGTPETDRFPRGRDHDPGNVLLVGTARAKDPAVQPIRTQRLGWHQKELIFAGDNDLDRFDQELGALLGDRVATDLLRLELRGPLGIEASARLEQKLASWRARLLRLKLLDHTAVVPSDAEIEALTRRAGDPLIARVAGELVARAGTPATPEAAAIAGVALRELYTRCGKQP